MSNAQRLVLIAGLSVSFWLVWNNQAGALVYVWIAAAAAYLYIPLTDLHEPAREGRNADAAEQDQGAGRPASINFRK
jgi:hypothetical protein